MFLNTAGCPALSEKRNWLAVKLPLELGIYRISTRVLLSIERGSILQFNNLFRAVKNGLQFKVIMRNR
jgi:hypothetical protein